VLFYIIYTYTQDAKNKAIEELECHSRDGFIASSHNKGGFRVRVFTDIATLNNSGYVVAHEKAQAEIERQIEYGYKQASEITYERFKAFFDAHKIEPKDVNYCHLSNLQIKSGSNTFDEVVEYIQDAEHECLGGSENTIMFEVRFMYHGCENGIHSASVSAAVNTESPYHREKISWAPNVFCEGGKEVEITWRKNNGLKLKLKRALNKVTSEVL
jgi:hypothetical protein